LSDLGVNKAALVLEHAEMAKGIALGYGQERHLSQALVDDLIQEAYVALAQAAESWDPLRGPFAQWARMRVGFHLLDVSRKDGPLTRREHAAGAEPPRMVELMLRAAADRLGADGFYFMPNLVYIAVREGHIT
jgi:DNA-directed RNA polymerase specialized sigma subunit